MSAPADVFMGTMRGHYPLSNNAGAARHWTDKNGVPMPDRSIGTLFWVSLLGGLFGLDHFYLRSPLTGLLKFITVGGIGLWYLWDVLQITTEKERVKMYGLSTPMDMTTGVGQGMITDKTNYVQKTSFILFAVLAMFGMEALAEGKFALLIRRLVDAAHFVPSVISLFTPSNSLWLRVVSAVSVVIYGIFLVLPWLAVVMAVLSGAEDGIVLPRQVSKLVNYFSFYTRSLGTHTVPGDKRSPTIVEKVLLDEFGYTNVPADQFAEKFRMIHKEEAAAEEEAKEEGDDTTSKWIPALWMGPLIPGIITRGLAAIPWIGNYVKLAIFSSFGDEEAKRLAFLGLTPAGAAAMAAADAAGIDPAAASAALDAMKDPAKLLKDPSAALSAVSQATGLPNVAALAKDPAAALSAASKAAGGPNLGAVLKNPAAAAAQAAGVNLTAASKMLNLAKDPAAAAQAAATMAGVNTSAAASALRAATNPSAVAQAALGAASRIGDPQAPNQSGGARSDPLSTESKVLAGTLFALIVGGGIKGAVDHFVGE